MIFNLVQDKIGCFLVRAWRGVAGEGQASKQTGARCVCLYMAFVVLLKHSRHPRILQYRVSVQALHRISA